MSDPHVIGDLRVELKFASQAVALEEQADLLATLRASLVDVAARLFDEKPAAGTVRIDRLALDLGDISRHKLRPELARRFEARLRDALDPLTARPAQSAAQNTPSDRVGDLDALAQFCDTGRLPWHVGAHARAPLLARLRQRVAQQPDAINALLASRSNHAVARFFELFARSDWDEVLADLLPSVGWPNAMRESEKTLPSGTDVPQGADAVQSDVQRFVAAYLAGMAGASQAESRIAGQPERNESAGDADLLWWSYARQRTDRKHDRHDDVTRRHAASMQWLAPEQRHALRDVAAGFARLPIPSAAEAPDEIRKLWLSAASDSVLAHWLGLAAAGVAHTTRFGLIEGLLRAAGSALGVTYTALLEKLLGATQDLGRTSEATALESVLRELAGRNARGLDRAAPDRADGAAGPPSGALQGPAAKVGAQATQEPQPTDDAGRLKWRALDALRDWSAGFSQGHSEPQLMQHLQDAYVQQPILLRRWFDAVAREASLHGAAPPTATQRAEPPSTPSPWPREGQQRPDFEQLARAVLGDRASQRSVTKAPEDLAPPNHTKSSGLADGAVAVLRRFAARWPGLLRGLLRRSIGDTEAQEAAVATLADALLAPDARVAGADQARMAHAFVQTLITEHRELVLTATQWRAWLTRASQAVPATTDERLRLVGQIANAKVESDTVLDAAPSASFDHLALGRAVRLLLPDRPTGEVRATLNDHLNSPATIAAFVQLRPESELAKALHALAPADATRLRRLMEVIAGAAFDKPTEPAAREVRLALWQAVFDWLCLRRLPVVAAPVAAFLARRMAPQIAHRAPHAFVNRLRARLPREARAGDWISGVLNDALGRTGSAVQERAPATHPMAADGASLDQGSSEPDNAGASARNASVATTDQVARSVSGREAEPSDPPEFSGRPSDFADADSALDADAGVIFVDNAGLVLLAPFLPRLLSTLDLVQGKAFTSPANHGYAAHVLQHCVSDSPDQPEYVLPLNKVLLGLPLAYRVPRVASLNRTTQETVHSLLVAVTEHWQALKNTSVDGLRTSFLQRPGALERVEAGWRLRVEQRPFDMLLDSLPWAYSLVRLPWMTEALHVEWR